MGAPRNNCLLPAALVYDPVTNPNGTRCGDADLATAVWGTTAGVVPGTVRARQTYDNVGIEYGLNALRSGAITPEEFVTLNEKAGGFDPDSNRIPTRTTADLPALDIAYRAGIVSSGTNLGKVPIIDSRGYDEQGIHYIWRTFSERARIEAANDGNHGNQVIWRYGTGLVPATAGPGHGGDAGVVPDDGHVAVATQRVLAQADAQLGAHPGRRDRGQAGYGVRPVLPDGRHQLHDPGHRHGAVRRRPEARHALVAAAGGRRVAAGERPQVPAQAARPRRLRAGRTRRSHSWRG